MESKKENVFLGINCGHDSSLLEFVVDTLLGMRFIVHARMSMYGEGSYLYCLNGLKDENKVALFIYCNISVCSKIYKLGKITSCLLKIVRILVGTSWPRSQEAALFDSRHL